ncbi:MAG: SDR family oxidoreductase [Flavobacteriales bacterium]|nr:SDR family oxidoreductase [Leptospiraceae bacterium]MCB9336318.1 SDR family oxidoreductase [Flavobacteriales bacterium]
MNYKNQNYSYNLKGRTAIITGGSSGIGFAIARILGFYGCNLSIVGREPKKLNLSKKKLKSLNIKIILNNCDLTLPESAPKVIESTIQEYKKIDILINNVGGLPSSGSFLDLTDEDWIQSFQLNLMSNIRITKAAIPYLQKSKAPRIINISSFVAKQPGNFNPHYSVFKAGILNLTKHLSNILAIDKILVNSISPGNIVTENWNDYITKKSEVERIARIQIEKQENKRVTEPTPLKRMGKPIEIASLVAFLSSDQAAFITGENFNIDGGRVKTI